MPIAHLPACLPPAVRCCRPEDKKLSQHDRLQRILHRIIKVGLGSRVCAHPPPHIKVGRRAAAGSAACLVLQFIAAAVRPLRHRHDGQAACGAGCWCFSAACSMLRALWLRAVYSASCSVVALCFLLRRTCHRTIKVPAPAAPPAATVLTCPASPWAGRAATWPTLSAPSLPPYLPTCSHTCSHPHTCI